MAKVYHKMAKVCNKKYIIVKVFCDFLEICENIMRRKLRNDKFVELTICQGFPMRKDEISKK